MPPADLFSKLDKCTQVNFFARARDVGLYPYFQPLQAAESARTRVFDREVVMLAANSYLGLSDDPQVIEAAVKATRHYGAGTSGSPMLNGTMDLHVALEQQLAQFVGKPAAMLMSTGFQTNLGVLSGLLGRGDVVLIDALAHASLHDGCRLSRADVWRFRHNDLAHLEHHLRAVSGRPTLVVVDGVYSMDGDLADLPGVCRLAKAYGARVLVDDAHGFGVLGPNGRGTCEHFGLLDEVDLISVTFSKSLGTIGGAVLGDRDVIHYLKHRSRPFIFSAALPPGTVAATHAALKRTMGAPALRRQLLRNVEFLRRELSDLGYRLGPSESQILPVLIGDDDQALRAGTQLLDEGVFVATVVSPGVPPGQARLRVSPMASHTRADLQTAVAAFARVGSRLGLVQRAGPPGALEMRVPRQSSLTVPEEVPCLDMP